MNTILLTQDSTFIIGQVAWVLGKIMEGIFTVINFIGLPNIGLAIILFTLVVNLLMMPLTIKQQKFSKLSAIMNPEIQAIQAKYKNKKDNDSMMAQNQEVQAVYARYGVSPTGSCVQLLIQMPILFALYRVIYAMPAYVGKIKEAFFPLVDKLIETAGSSEFIQKFNTSMMYSRQFTNEAFVAGNTEYVQNTLIDCLNKASTADLMSISQQFPQLTQDVNNTLQQMDRYNNFLGLNIGNSPSYIIGDAWANIQNTANQGATLVFWFMLIGALAIPVLSALTQWINVKLMPQQSTGNDQANSMAKSMKIMNTIMPLFSAWFCFTVPTGLGLYWVAGSVVRSILQIVVNKHIDKMDFESVIKKNSVKSAKKLEKLKVQQERMNTYASMNTRSIQNKANISSNMTDEQREEAMKKSTSYYNNGNAKQGSLMAKANMVKQYNEKNNKDKKDNKGSKN